MTAFPDMRVLLDHLVIQSDGAVFHWTLPGGRTRAPAEPAIAYASADFERWQFAPDGLIGRAGGNFDAADYQYQIQHGSHPASSS